MDINFKDIGDVVDCTIEECAELIKALCKAKRFGWDNWNPYDPNKRTNIDRALDELVDLNSRLEQLEKYLLEIKYPSFE